MLLIIACMVKSKKEQLLQKAVLQKVCDINRKGRTCCRAMFQTMGSIIQVLIYSVHVAFETE